MLLISNAIGYVIHALFSIGGRLGCERWAKQAGYAAKVAYFTVVPMVAQTPVETSSMTASLPHTASDLPMFAFGGVVALMLAGALSLLRVLR